MRELKKRDRKAFAKCVARIQRLAECGHELRRPEADLLRDEIYELRAKRGHVHYRILYFFHGRGLAVLAHALTKEDTVPNADIERAVRRKNAFRKNPERHSLHAEEGDIESG